MFSLDKIQVKKLAKWSKQQELKAARLQKKSKRSEKDLPYYGAIGGAYTYSFTPTSLGMVVKVTNGLTNETIDLTDYDW